MSNDQMKIMEFVFEYEREKWNNGKWMPSVRDIINGMKNDFDCDWSELFTQNVLNEMQSKGWLEIK